MQKDKDPLNIDLTFLDEKPRQDAPPPVDTAYKYNWKNIAIIAAIVLGIGAIIVANDNSTPTSTPTPQSTTWTPPVIAPSDRPPPFYGSGTVAVGQFRCSKYDSSRADQLRPMNSTTLKAAEQAMETRSNALVSLRLRIETSTVMSYSPQIVIDQHNEMVDQYNAMLRSFRSDSAILQAKINRFNAQVEAYNAYLLAHCTRG